MPNNNDVNDSIVLTSGFDTFLLPLKRSLVSLTFVSVVNSISFTIPNHMVFLKSFLLFTVFKYTCNLGKLLLFTNISNLLLHISIVGTMPLFLD